MTLEPCAFPRSPTPTVPLSIDLIQGDKSHLGVHQLGRLPFLEIGRSSDGECGI